MSYTNLLVENWELLASISVLDHATEQNLSARVDIGDYTRFAVIVITESGSGNAIDLDIEQANALTGGTLKTLNTNAHDLTIGDTDVANITEFRSEQFDTNNGFNYLNVEMTPAAARMCGLVVLGLAKHRPASVTPWGQQDAS